MLDNPPWEVYSLPTMKRHHIFIFAILLSLQQAIASSVYITTAQSVTFESFGSDVQHVYEPQKDQRGLVEGWYPDDPPFPPADPVHDNNDKFRIRCEDVKGVIDCQDVFTTTLTWNTAYPGHTKTCSVEVKLQIHWEVYDGDIDRKRTYTTNGDCSVTKTTSDGQELWVVHPNTRSGTRTMSMRFIGYFNPLDAAIWSNQIYAHLNAPFADSTRYFPGSYNVSSDGSSLTISIPTYYELPYA